MQAATKVDHGLQTRVQVSMRLGDAIAALAAVLLVAVVAGYALGSASEAGLVVSVPAANLGAQAAWSASLALIGGFLFALAAVWDRHVARAKITTLAVVGCTLAGAGITGLLLATIG